MISACVVATDVISYLFKDAGEAELYRPHLTGRLLTVSFMSIAELERWVLHNNWGAARIGRLNAYLRQFAMHRSSRALCRMWAEVVETEQRKGRKLNTADAWIAATAIINNLSLVSHNRKHFEEVDRLVLISEG
jgi:tRNA(fMet)-specific endonuclease VapC